MTSSAERRQAKVIDELAEEARAKLGKDGDTGEAFVRRYLDGIPPEDFIESPPETLLGGALSLFATLHKRKPGKPDIRVFNPSTKRDGWRSPHTVIELINDDMPFLVDSTTAELNRNGLTVYLVVHPVMHVLRDADGTLLDICDPGAAPPEATAESVMHIEVNEQTMPATLRRLQGDLARVLGDVRASVEDWRAMRVRIANVLAELDSNPPPLPRPEIEEGKAFLRWLDDNNFTFLGSRDYAFKEDKGKFTLQAVPRSGLGVLRHANVEVFEGIDDNAVLPVEIAAFVRTPRLLMLSKATQRSTVHRAVHLDTISVKKFGDKGAVIGETLFVGLYASGVYTQSVRTVPVLRHRVEMVIERSGLSPSGHDGKALAHILETFPRDDLFEASIDDLQNMAMRILHLQERQRVALVARHDPFGRYVSCLVYLPRERYTTATRTRMQRIIENGFDGSIAAYYVEVSDAVLARLHFIVKTLPGQPFPKNEDEIEEELIEAGRDWPDDLSHALVECHGEGRGLELYRIYGEAFPHSYRERMPARAALVDIEKADEARNSGQIAMRLMPDQDGAPGALRFKVYSPEAPLPLSDVLPVLENAGLRVIAEVPDRLRPRDDGPRVWIHDFTVETRRKGDIDVASLGVGFEDMFARVWRGEIENDGFNQLVLGAGLAWREIVLLRAIAKYLRQAAIPFSQAYMEQTLDNHPAIARSFVALFEALFKPGPDPDRNRQISTLRTDIAEAIEGVMNPDEDRILRRYNNVVESMLRTNYYQPAADGGPKPYISFKLDSRNIEELPLPRPHVEVFVYSPRVEAIHLRGGKVARGGIRWSDRREDFRTEVLGLMKAQMTKNAVIVPVGAKGGFVVKQPPAGGGREALMDEGIACYTTFMHGLLDITDNRTPDALVPPPDVIRRDDDDPYLVVAADKGTATFSDIANGIAAEYGFWLDDAFASGGSAGYDHKKMGITARGAWESVKRHFRELGTDIQQQPFTVVGVGDMSGDVFGNGMLLSEQTRLLGAFNHLHVFVDPDPDPAKSFAERQRLFDLPRSSWSDYDKSVLSAGGAIYERSAKSLKLTPEIRQMLGVHKETMTPAELIRALMKHRVDLLWFGGIGTYVKAHDESDVEVGDRNNDSLRVAGRDLNCRVVGEGANLGVTQLGRIEYALKAGRINTDAIDNSAGVDASDHEVNIKILLGEVEAAGALDRKLRNRLLADMTDDVAAHVLLDNYRQSMVLTNAEAQAAEQIEACTRLIKRLERDGRLDRSVENLPDDETLAERKAARLGLVRPELSVLLAYAKLDLFDALIASDLPDDPFLVEDVGLYFPEALRGKYGEFIPRHRLRREISATYLTNSLINRMGPTFISELAYMTGASSPDIARAYLAARQTYALSGLWSQIEALDSPELTALQTELHLRVIRFTASATRWFLLDGDPAFDIERSIGAFAPGIRTLSEKLPELITAEQRETVAAEAAALVERGTPEALARDIASLEVLFAACDIVRIATADKKGVEDVARTFFALGAQFGLDWLRRKAAMLAPETEWQRMAVAAIVDELYEEQRALTTSVIHAANGSAVTEAGLEAWRGAHAASVLRLETLLSEFRAAPTVDLAMLAVANREIRSLNGA